MPMDPDDALALIQRALIAVAPQRAPEFQALSPETLIASLRLDSIRRVEMIGYIEDEMGILFEDEELIQLDTVASLVALIAGR